MSIASEITRIQDAKSDIADAIEAKGVTVPASTKIDGYAALVSAIPQGASEITYPVVEKIRARYTVDDELALLRQRDVKPDEFAEYNAYCEACKAEAKAETEGV